MQTKQKEPDLHPTPLFSASGKWDSNPRPSAWEADALPLSYSRSNLNETGLECFNFQTGCKYIKLLGFAKGCGNLLSQNYSLHCR